MIRFANLRHTKSLAAHRSLVALLSFGLLLITGIQAQAQAASIKQVDEWRQQMHRALFIPNPLLAVSPEFYGSFAPIPEVVAERVSYRTEYGLRIPAIVYRPARTPKGKMPAIVVVNGHGGDKSSWYAYYTGVLYAQAGAVVLTYDPIGEGERNDDHKVNAGEHDKLILDPPSMPARMGGLMVTDVMQAVSYLGQRPDVDAHRIAVMGFSMGTFISALAGAADPRIHALLLVGGGDLDGPGGYWESSHAVMCQSGPYKALAFMGDRPAVLYTLNARRGSTFIINGTNDTVVDIPHHEQDFFDELRKRVIAMNGSDRGIFTTYFDPGASHRPSWITRTAAEWLDRQLNFPNWPQSSIASLPVTTIRAWGTSVGYTFNKSSEREDRDAGIVAISGHVPLMTSTQTDILSPAAWQLLKGDFIYSSWVQRALADARGSPVSTEAAK
jgi:dienelactone hydrolase